jgi:heat shock protein HtpX
MKRIVLFVITNMLMVLTISLLVSVLGLGQYLSAQGIDYGRLAALCLVWGMSGSLISLAISRISAKWMMGVTVVSRTSPEFGALVSMVEGLARKAGLPAVPEVGIYESPEVNAFATGPSKRRSLVAFSTGLLNSMNSQEIEGVAAHEIAHIANGDMVTMTLLQGIVNAFVMFLARAISFVLTQSSRDENRSSSSSALSQQMIVMLLELVLGLLGTLVVCWFSRWREFRADRGGAQYAGKADMIAALQRLAGQQRMISTDHPAVASLKISGGIGHLFATHPPLQKRIAALQQAA